MDLLRNDNPCDVEAGQLSMAGRIRPAITSLQPARAVCHPARAGAERLDTPLAEAIHARSLEPSRRTPAADGGIAVRRRPARTAAAIRSYAGSRLINSFSSLPDLK